MKELAAAISPPSNRTGRTLRNETRLDLRKEPIPTQTACHDEFKWARLCPSQVFACILTFEKARVAQRQSRGLISPWSQVQILPLAPSLAKKRYNYLPTMRIAAGKNFRLPGAANNRSLRLFEEFPHSIP